MKFTIIGRKIEVTDKVEIMLRRSSRSWTSFSEMSPRRELFWEQLRKMNI